MSQSQPPSETKWAETKLPGRREGLCKKIGRVHRAGANGGGGQICWGAGGHISTKGSSRTL